MKQLGRKRHTKRILYSTVTLVVLSLIVIGLARSVWAVYKSSRAAAEKRNAAQIELDKLTARKIELEAQVAEMKTDRGAEGQVRERFQVARPGEETIVIIDNPADATGTATNTATTTGNGFFNTVRNLFVR
jgi:cell division protein FtsB